jgi:PIN domain
MDSQPLKRIYFDTNALYGWPYLPNETSNLLRFADWLGAELYLPKIVEAELERQFLKRVKTAYASVESGLKEINKACRPITSVQVQVHRYSDEDLRKAFATATHNLRVHYQIGEVYFMGGSLQDFVTMAINRQVPFQEETISGGRSAVVGLQDAAILFSIIDHIKEESEEIGRCAFVTNDGVFHKPEMIALLKEHKVELEMFKTAKAVFDDIVPFVSKSIGDEWTEEMKQIDVRLNKIKEELGTQILPLLNPSDVRRDFWQTGKEIKTFSVKNFYSVQTELPDSKYMPPDSPIYERPEGDEVKISAKCNVVINAIVETYPILEVFARQDEKLEDQPISAKIEEAILRPTLNISLTGKVHDHVVGDFKVTSVQVER